MPYDRELAHRVRELVAHESGLTEMAMFGGLAFMLDGHMAVGVSSGGELMVRVGREHDERALSRPHARIFDLGGRPMRGWLLIAAPGVRTRRQLEVWVERGVRFARTLPPKATRSPGRMQVAR